MREAITTTAGMTMLLLGIWWVALIVIAVKGWLFHRDEPTTEQEIPDDPEMAAELATLQPAPRGCVWAFVFFVWPLVLADYLDRQSKQ